MDEMLNNIDSGSAEPEEEKALPETEEKSSDSAGETIPEEDNEAPAEMSLEGRKTQLEEKVSAELEKTELSKAPEAPSPYTAPRSDMMQPYTANRPQKEKMPTGAKSYIILIAGLIVVFLIAFVLENVRTYKEDGLFGGDLERFLDSDFAYDPFGRFDDSDEDRDESVTDSEASDTDTADDTDTLEIKPAPDVKSVIDPSSAKLKAEDQPKDIDSPEFTTRKAYKKVESSVVGIIVYVDKNDVGNEIYKSGTGSGLIVSSDGYVITNSHVVGDSSEYGAEVVTSEGKHYSAAIVGFDSRTDLAVLKIDAEGLTAAEFVNSDQIEVGQDALVVGYPGGLKYSNSLTRGCVSALNRTVRDQRLGSYIQTDAAINPGNSGGPLLNSAGQVMGIATIKIASTDYEGMGFAIPSNLVIEIANDLIGQGYISGRVKLGLRITDTVVSPTVQGLEIVEVFPESPLMKTEVEIGDVITKFDGKAVTSTNTLYSLLGEHDPGDLVTLTIYRPPTPGKADKTFDVTIPVIADTGETEE